MAVTAGLEMATMATGLSLSSSSLVARSSAATASLTPPPSCPRTSVSIRARTRLAQQKRGSCILVRAEGSEAPAAEPPAPPKPSLAKGSIVSVDKEKYLASVEFKAVDHPPYFKGLDYIYEARGEVLDARIFDSGEYALVAWAGIPTAPAWLPAYMLTKEKALSYKRT